MPNETSEGFPVLIHAWWGPALIFIVQGPAAHCFPVCGPGGCCNVLGQSPHRGARNTNSRGLCRAQPSYDMSTSRLGHWPTTVWLHERGILRSGFAIGMNNRLQYLSCFAISNSVSQQFLILFFLFCFWKQITDRFKQCNQTVRAHYENVAVLYGIKLTFNRSRILTSSHYCIIFYLFRVVIFQKV